MFDPKKLFKSLAKKCGSEITAGKIIRKDFIPLLEKQYKDLEPYGIDYRSRRYWDEKGTELKDVVKKLKSLGIPGNKNKKKK